MLAPSARGTNVPPTWTQSHTDLVGDQCLPVIYTRIKMHSLIKLIVDILLLHTRPRVVSRRPHKLIIAFLCEFLSNPNDFDSSSTHHTSQCIFVSPYVHMSCSVLLHKQLLVVSLRGDHLIMKTNTFFTLFLMRCI